VRDYAKDWLDQGRLTQAEYDALLESRAVDAAETHLRLSEASERGDVRRRQSLKLIGDGGVGWQSDLDEWGGR
jgi:hypothetical protein